MAAEFTVVPGAAAAEILADSHQEILRVVTDAYLAHEQGQSVNPDSYFLRFPDKPEARVIALPAYLGGTVDAIGIKWIASFPGNVDRNMPRASAVLVLNDYATGHPLACLEAAGISAARTAASAAVAAAALTPSTEPVRAAFVGAGVIARTIFDYLHAAGVAMSEVWVHDLDATSAGNLAAHVASRSDVRVVAESTLGEALDRDLVVFATTAGAPYVPAGTELRPGQTVLNISLRDLAPEILLTADNLVDDVEHCLKAQTSPHLAEQLTGSRDFITGTLGGVLRGDTVLSADRPTIFSPFGLGILDIAVGCHVLQRARERGTAVEIPGFFGQTRRW